MISNKAFENIEKENAMLIKPLADFMIALQKTHKIILRGRHRIRIDFDIEKENTDPHGIIFYFDGLGIYMGDGKAHKE